MTELFRAPTHVQTKIESLLRKQRVKGLTDEEQAELDRCEEMDDALSLANRAIRNLNILNKELTMTEEPGQYRISGRYEGVYIPRANVMIDMVPIRYTLLHPDAQPPRYQHGEEDSGFDLSSIDDYVITPGGRVSVQTGLALELPRGTELQVRPRSGLALRNGITVLNTPGTVDRGYRGEIRVILINHDQHSEFLIKKGDRIAQAVIAPVLHLPFEAAPLSESERGADGFGSTGVAG